MFDIKSVTLTILQAHFEREIDISEKSRKSQISQERAEKKKKNDFRGRGGTGYHTHAHIHTHTPSDPGSHRLLNASAYHLKLVKCAAGVRLSSHPAKKSYFFLKMCLHINFDFFAQKSSVFLNQKFPNSSFSLKLHL